MLCPTHSSKKLPCERSKSKKKAKLQQYAIVPVIHNCVLLYLIVSSDDPSLNFTDHLLTLMIWIHPLQCKWMNFGLPHLF